MKNSYFKISMLLLALLTASCTKDEDKAINTKVSKSQVALRPTVPILNNEVKIGAQVWMTRNLNVSRYRNGDPIPQVQDFMQWINITTGAWCYYQNNTSNGVVYGKLYNWYAVNDPRGLAPAGYHVPSDAEWTTLTTFLGGTNLAGGQMKATNLWLAPNTGATNSSGFTGIPGGSRDHLGPFYYLGEFGYWWSSSEYSTDIARYCALYYNYAESYQAFYYKANGLSVRCIRD
jgi:uncharacterized protein (TIGR02145 family)